MVDKTGLRDESDVDDLIGDAPLRAQGTEVDRRSRELKDRVGLEAREMSDEDEKFALFAQTLFNGVLPDLPAIPGFHVCWLSTNHQADPISRRMRLGYTPVLPSEVAGMELATLKSGEYAGLVGVNEMVAFKLPSSLYLRFMQEAHHDEPNRQVELINTQVDALKSNAARDGGRIVEGNGMEDLRRSAPSKGIFAN